MINNILILSVGYLYLVGAFLTYWIIDESVQSRSTCAALWPILMPIQILGEQLGKRDGDDDGDNPDDYGV